MEKEDFSGFILYVVVPHVLSIVVPQMFVFTILVIVLRKIGFL